MERGRWIPAVLACLTAAVLILALGRGVRRTVRLSLPETTGILGPSIEDPDGAGRPDVIEVTPDTVQAAVATLRRPEAWSRTVAVTQYWSGGSGSSIAEVSVRGPWTRVDQTLPDGRIRHCLTDGSRTWIWYGDGGAVWNGPAGGISADDEQHVPTYEDLLDLPKDRIQRAGLQSMAGDACIYVETDDGDGRTGLWWIGLDTGLLTAAERLAGGETIYRMEALPLDRTDPDPGRFLLPDGTDPAAIPEVPEEPELPEALEDLGIPGDPVPPREDVEDPASADAEGSVPDDLVSVETPAGAVPVDAPAYRNDRRAVRSPRRYGGRPHASILDDGAQRSESFGRSKRGLFKAPSWPPEARPVFRTPPDPRRTAV